MIFDGGREENRLDAVLRTWPLALQTPEGGLCIFPMKRTDSMDVFLGTVSVSAFLGRSATPRAHRSPWHAARISGEG